MTMQPAATIWLVTACFMLLTLPMLLAAEKQVPDERADDEKYWGRAVILALVVLLSAHSWACLSNAAFDQSAGSAQTAYITENGGKSINLAGIIIFGSRRRGRRNR